MMIFVKMYCLERVNTGWYSGVINGLDGETGQVCYAGTDTYTEHKVSDEKLKSEDGSNKFRINDAIALLQMGPPNLTVRVV